MANKSRERNYVNLFSDYGLDERQKNLSAEVGFKCFKLASAVFTILTLVWIGVYTVDGMPEIHPAYSVLSYFAAIIFIRCLYAVRTSKLGVMNRITAFSSITGGIIVITVCLAVTAVCAALTAFNSSSMAEGTEFIAIIFGLCAISNIIMYICGKRNFKVLDVDSTDESEEE